MFALPNKHLSLVLAALLTCLCACSHPAKENVRAEAANNTGNEHTAKPAPPAPQYQGVLDKLQNDELTLLELADIHPIHTVYNREAIIPPMCYTRTEGVHNPCYVCHQDEVKGRENTMNDADLQEAYSFSDLGMKNHWHNLFEDRTDKVAKISDEEILSWVNQDNYSDLAERLRAINFSGYIPDLDNLQNAAAAFDSEGFALDGSHWVAFNYKPMPSTFWPTNGATDDVMIRLAKVYRTDTDGNYSRDIYKANLALLEAKIKGLSSITVNKVNERAFNKDLNQDGKFGVINKITDVSNYVGAARNHFQVIGTYPLNTEFLHSVRYLGINTHSEIFIPKRMKELRYMKKQFMLSKPQIIEAYLQEGYEKQLGQPTRLCRPWSQRSRQ